MRILITGGTGLLGRALVDKSASRYQIMATYLGECPLGNNSRVTYRKLDVRDKKACHLLFAEFKPDVTIHTAGIGSPDYAEKHKKDAHDINVGGTKNVSEECEACGSKFIYISSNGIYDGERAPYDEEAEALPINFYGIIKLEGEMVARRAKVTSAVVRPILMYGWNHPHGRKNIVSFALSRLSAGEKVFAYDDVYVTPLFVDNCADAIWNMVEKEIYETFNIGGDERSSIYELVKNAARIFDKDVKLVLPVKQGFFNEFVKRPRDTSFQTGKMHRVLGVKPLSIREGLTLMKSLEKR